MYIIAMAGITTYFDEKPDVSTVLPDTVTRNTTLKKKPCCTCNMPMFVKTCKLSVAFNIWLKSPGDSGIEASQADRITCKILEYTKFCCKDVNMHWDIPFFRC